MKNTKTVQPKTPRVKKATKEEIGAIKQRFLEHYPDSKTELEYRSAYELLVCIILSAQCTDKRVNLITPALFEAFPDIESLAQATEESVREKIRSCTYFNNKTKSLIQMARSVLEQFDGTIPMTQKELMQLAGVGQKTANVFLIEYAQADLMAVDTHVFRVAHRLGLSKATTAPKTEEDLIKAFKDHLHLLHQAMVLFGRYICKSQSPLCDSECFLNELCKSKAPFKVK